MKNFDNQLKELKKFGKQIEKNVDEWGYNDFKEVSEFHAQKRKLYADISAELFAIMEEHVVVRQYENLRNKQNEMICWGNFELPK